MDMVPRLPAPIALSISGSAHGSYRVVPNDRHYSRIVWVERLLDEAEEAITELDWRLVYVFTKITGEPVFDHHPTAEGGCFSGYHLLKTVQTLEPQLSRSREGSDHRYVPIHSDVARSHAGADPGLVPHRPPLEGRTGVRTRNYGDEPRYYIFIQALSILAFQGIARSRATVDIPTALAAYIHGQVEPDGRSLPPSPPRGFPPPVPGSKLATTSTSRSMAISQGPAPGQISG